jgi:integrase
MHLSRMNVRVDRRHDRRALSQDEFRRLLEAAQSGKQIEGISGPDRAMIYTRAAWTGFGRGEIGSLAKRSFHLDSNPATVTVEACYSKRRREDTQVLHPDVAKRIKAWLETKKRLGPTSTASGISFSRTWNGRASGRRWPKPWPDIATLA